MSGRRSWRVTCGRLRRFYLQARIGETWVTQGSARTPEQLAALIARVAARRPGAALVVVSFDSKGNRTEEAA